MTFQIQIMLLDIAVQDMFIMEKFLSPLLNLDLAKNIFLLTGWNTSPGNISQRLRDVKNSIGLELSPNGKFAMIPVGEAKGKI